MMVYLNQINSFKFARHSTLFSKTTKQSTILQDPMQNQQDPSQIQMVLHRRHRCHRRLCRYHNLLLLIHYHQTQMNKHQTSPTTTGSS